MKRKRIICTVTNDLNTDQRMIRICSSLQSYGYEVCLVGRKHQQSKALCTQSFQQKRFSMFFESGKLFYLEYNLRLFFWLLIARFDLVCSIDLDSLLAGFLSTKIKNKPLVYDAHEYFTEVPEVVDRPFTKRVWESLADWIIPKLDHAYTVGTDLAMIFEKRYQTRFDVIRNVPVRKKEMKKPQGYGTTFIILYQGALNEGRGLEEAIDAMAFMDDTELWLAGEGDLSEMLRKKVRQQDLSDKVVFHGWVAPSALHSLTLQAHLGLNLLKNKGLSYYHSLANKTFDYMQAGIPSICMAFPEYRRLNDEIESLLLINELTAHSIAAGMMRMKNETILYKRLCKNAKRAAQEYTWEKEEKRLLEIYKTILS